MPELKQNGGAVIAFICEPGELEINSLLLAYSIRKNNKIDLELIVLIPSHLKYFIKPITLQIFQELSVELKYFENLITCNKKVLEPGDAMSNKFFGLNSFSGNKNVLFLDSDIVCLNPFPAELFLNTVAAKPADFCLKATWEEIFRLVNLKYPKEVIKCTVDDMESPPYFNTGVVFIPGAYLADICKWWKDFFVFFSNERNLEKKLFNPFHRDQLAFALATEKLGIQVKLLDEMYNFPARSRGNINAETIFAHYHDSYTIGNEPLLLNVLQSFVSEHPMYRKIFDKNRTWKLLAKQRLTLLMIDKIRAEIIKKFMRILSRMK